MENYEKRGYLLENFRLFHLRSQGSTGVELHYHEFCKLLLLLSGRGSYYIDGQHYLLQPGDIVAIGSRSIHKPELDGDAVYERIIIYISPEHLKKLSGEDCDLLGLFSGRGGHVLRPRESKRRQLQLLAGELEQALSREGFGREILSDACLTRLLVELGRCRENPGALDPSPSLPENRRICRIMDYLDRNLTEQINMDHLAERFFLSKYHMMRQFRQQTGSTIYTYLTQKRLMLAAEQMRRGMSATDACYSSGFRSYSSFTRAYAKYCGTTPTGRSENRLVRDEDFE